MPTYQHIMKGAWITMMNTASYWIEKLGLVKHPEGGYFKETYRSDEIAAGVPQRFSGPRSFSTAIYFLLPHDEVSHFHRIRSDEIWHFYCGENVIIHILHENGRYENMTIGMEAGCFQAVVPKNAWFGANVPSGTGYALVGCTVSPGFAFEDFELADRKALLKAYPLHDAIIKQLTEGADETD